MCNNGLGRRQGGSAIAPKSLRNIFIKEPSVSENESKHFKEVFSSFHRNNLNKIILAQLNINFLRSKFDLLFDVMAGNVDVFMISETKINETFPSSQFLIAGHAPCYRLDRNCNRGGILFYNPEDTPSRLIEIYRFTEYLFVEFNFRKKKWLLCGPYNPNKTSFQIILRLLINVLLFDQVW